MLPKSPKTHAKILRSLILQSLDRSIYTGVGRYVYGVSLDHRFHWSTGGCDGLHLGSGGTECGNIQEEREGPLCGTGLDLHICCFFLVFRHGKRALSLECHQHTSDEVQYIMYHSDYWLNLQNLWINWPDREMDGLFKWYYLVQFAFWLQQILVVNIEERRKDYAQMFTHHVVTSCLMLTSYGYHQTRVGNVILCLMDAVDIVLPVSIDRILSTWSLPADILKPQLAKMLKYLKYQTACDIAFGVFMVTWVVSRHILYLIVCYSVYADIPREINYGCYWGSNANLQGPVPLSDSFDHLTRPFRDPEGLVCWNNSIKWGFLAMLLFLQVILLIWFGMIARVAWKVIQGQAADDSRSDDEEEEEEDEVQLPSNPYRMDPSNTAPPLEEEVGVEAINLAGRKSSPARRYRKGATASGVTLHSDRKELLGRIGCDKGS